MSEQAIESRLSRLEEGQTEVKTWRQEMEEASREFWRSLKETERFNQQTSEEARRRGEELDRRFQETDRIIQRNAEEARRRSEELDRQFQRNAEEDRRRSEDLDQQFQQTSEEARRRSEKLDRRFQETDRLFRETDRKFQEASEEDRRRSEERARELKETSRMIKELGQQIGGLGQKFGGFTEGLAAPSMEQRLAERFGTTGFVVRPRVRLGAEELEVDALAYSVGESGTVCAVDVKSRLRDEGIDQLLRSLAKFPRFFPEHRGKRLIGVLAAVDLSQAQEERILREGLVLARISGEVFDLRIPEGYEPRSFPNPPAPVA